ncbi:MAG: hypothetical protein AAGG56_03650 [Pseudomonadota bacterium]
MDVTTGMVGHGFYNRNSAPQMAAIDYVLPWLDRAVAELPLATGAQTIGIADFGCSEGRNSIAVMQRVTQDLRRRTSDPILTVHSDLPTNDFSALFRDLRPDGQSVFGDDQISSCAVGGSMFDQLLPPSSLHLATTFNAIGFLSCRPVARLPGYILPNGPSHVRANGSVTEDERAIFARQAEDDIASFLEARANELVPGGKVLLQVFGADGDQRTCDGIYDALNDAVLETVEEGVITRDAYEAYYQPVYFRTLEEILAPVVAGRVPFRIEISESYTAPVPFNEDFQRTGDVHAYAREYTNFYRAFTEAVLRLSFPELPDPDGFVTDVYDRAERLVRSHPDRYPFRYVAVAALLTRI